MSSKLLPSAINDPIVAVTPPSSIKRSKARPMIVDITLNDNGEQVYKVQGTSTRTSSRKRKLSSMDDSDVGSKRATPVRSILSAVSPNTLNKNKYDGDHNDNEEDEEDEDDDSKLNGSPSIRKKDNNDDNIWSQDVEDAFKEALEMIPKNGLAKIKISGKSCGRNELISDYIIQKTGKIRTRKQVSSHIQVIKNLRKNQDLIKLINNGPTDPAALEKFDQVFSEISFKKSLGTTGPSGIDLTAVSKPCTPISKKKHVNSRKSTPRAPVQHRRKSHFNNHQKFKNVYFGMRKFLIWNKESRFVFSQLASKKLERSLRLKPNASVQNRFPNLNDYLFDDIDQDDQIPILHNLVHLNLFKTSRLNLNGEHDTVLEIDLQNIPIDESEYGCITMIYSFGNEVIKLNDEAFIIRESENLSSETKNISLKLNFAKDFWVAFFNSLEKNVNDDLVKCENQKTIAVKAITMKQVIFHKRRSSGFDKDDIRGIILWEFTRNSKNSSETTSRRLYLPNNSAVKQEEINFLSKLSEPHDVEQEKQQQQLPAEGPFQHQHTPQHQFALDSYPHSHPHPQLQLSIPQRQPYHSQTIVYTTSASDEYEKDSANTTLQFDDEFDVTSDIVPISQPSSQTLRSNSLPNYATNREFPDNQSSSSLWNLQQNPNQHQVTITINDTTAIQGQSPIAPQLGLPTSTTSTISSDGFNTDEFQGFHQSLNHHVVIGHLNPGFMHEFDPAGNSVGHGNGKSNFIKIEHADFNHEVFPTW